MQWQKRKANLQNILELGKRQMRNSLICSQLLWAYLAGAWVSFFYTGSSLWGRPPSQWTFLKLASFFKSLLYKLSSKVNSFLYSLSLSGYFAGLKILSNGSEKVGLEWEDLGLIQLSQIWKFMRCVRPQIANPQIFMINPQIANPQMYKN